MRYRFDDQNIDEEAIAANAAKYGYKLLWFIEHGYAPHFWQLIFHTLSTGDTLTRFRHLVAGRRGGKTLSAAWEVLFYSLFPEYFHLDAHGQTDNDRHLWTWVLTKDHPTGRPALLTFREALAQAGLKHGVDFKENRGNRYFEFENGSLVEFKTADDPQSLRGAGLDLLWMDEAAFIPNEEAYEVVYPALADKSGLVISTTTPQGKNWFYERFWEGNALEDPNIGRVEYRSIDNTYFSQDEWRYYQETYHPMLFQREFMAAFDSMEGQELHGDWLQYYDLADLPRKDDGGYDLDYFMGVDPAISLSDRADNFTIALIGIDRSKGQAYLVDQYKGRIPFPEQVELIQDWYHTYNPLIIGIENTAFQAALEQQVARLEALAPVSPVPAKGKKSSRILSMAPLFRLGRVKIRKDHKDFIQEWVGYDSTIKNPKDDCLDSVEIAIRSAGVLLPTPDRARGSGLPKYMTPDEMARKDIEDSLPLTKRRVQDTHLGEYW